MNPKAILRSKNRTNTKNAVSARPSEKQGESFGSAYKAAIIRTQATMQPDRTTIAVKRYPNQRPSGGRFNKGRAVSTKMGIDSNEVNTIR